MEQMQKIHKMLKNLNGYFKVKNDGTKRQKFI